MKTSHAPADAAISRLLHSYGAQFGAEPGDGPDAARAPIALTVDGQYRIRLRALPRGGIVVQSRLRRLPGRRAVRE